MKSRDARYTFPWALLIISLVAACDTATPDDPLPIVWEYASTIELESLRVSEGGELFGNRRGSISWSSNNGSSWVEVFEGRASVLGLGVGGTICTNDSEPGALFRDAVIYCSTDAGATWSRAPDNSNFLGVDITAMELRDDGQLLVGTSGRVHQGGQAKPKRGLFVSSDLGQTWQETSLTTDDPLAGIEASYSMDGGDLLVVRYQRLAITDNIAGYFRSIDGGQTWEGLPKPPFDQFLVQAMSRSRDGAIYAAGAEAFPGVGRVDGVYSSVDLGESWTRTSFRSDREVLGATALPDGRVIVSAGFDGVFVSDDHGSIWQATNEGLPVSSIGTLDVSVRQLFAGPGFLFALTDQGLYRARLGGE
ncbi:MAG: exo-alpha-sialidase [Rhodothermales bacterium]|nr:exo-alpha-sialidase [Rhodothermales bacterium]